MNRPTHKHQIPLQTTYSYRPRRYVPVSPTPRRHKKISRIGAYFIVAVIGFSIVSHIATTHAHKAPDSRLTSQLQTQLLQTVQQHPDDNISVSLIDLATGKQMHVGDPAAYDAASTAKLIAACAYYHLAEQGKVNLQDSLGAYTAQFQLQEMIQDSDNDSWSLLSSQMGLPYLASYAQSIGLHYNTATNSLTSDDIALLLSKLYTGKLLDTHDTVSLLSYMQQTNDEDLIPAALPSGVTVYHKYGLLSGVLHDASVVVKNNQAYVFVVYTKSQDDSNDDARTAVIHQLTQTVTNALFS